MKRVNVFLFLVAFVLSSISALAQDQVVFDFQARVKTKGKPFNGVGLFMFTILAKDGPTEYVLWHNSGDVSNPSPDAAVPLVVIDGFASVLIGDTSLTNMAALDAVIFQNDGPLFLRVWFDDGENGTQQLSPDQPVNNPKLIGIRSTDEVNLYVNAATGNDNNSGDRPEKAKKTVSAAIRALPPRIEHPATVHVADGAYYEAVVLKNFSASGPDAILTILGNETTPSSVVITGATSDVDPTPARMHCLLMEDSSQVMLKGLRFERTYDPKYRFATDRTGGVVAYRSSFEAMNCEFAYHEDAGIKLSKSQLELEDCLLEHCKVGVRVHFESALNIWGCQIQNISGIGLYANQNSHLYCDSTIIDGVTGSGLGGYGCSTIVFRENSVIRNAINGIGLVGCSYAGLYHSLIENCSQWGLHAESNSYARIGITAEEPLEIKNCAVAVHVDFGARVENALGTELILTSNTVNAQTANDGKVYNIP